MKYKYNHAILGGTFDHFHLGHKHFIDSALGAAQKITIGVTTSKLHRNKFLPWSIENYETREKALIAYLQTKNCQDRVTIIPLNDIYGPALREKNLDAIFVTEAGVNNANIINQERVKLNFPELQIVVVYFIKGDDGKVISSKRIRAGEIDREGHAYMKIFADSKNSHQRRAWILTDKLRGEVKNTPSGKLIQTDNDYKNAISGKFVIAVGDIVTKRLLEQGGQADVSIIDFKSERRHVRKIFVKPTVETENNPGTINRNAVLTLREALNKALSGSRQVIKVIGEEDLLALPATLLAPLGSIVLYGMPDKGAIVVEVTEEKKAEVVNLVRKFKEV